MKFLTRVPILAIEYSIYLASDAELAEIAGFPAEGLTEVCACRILLSKDLLPHPTRLLNVLIHELTHALLESSGVDYWLRRKKYDEETFVRFLTPALTSVLLACGALQMPSWLSKQVP